VKRSILKSPGIRAVILLAFVGGIVLWIFWPRGLPPPDERNRTMHPAGYSIIMPPEWEPRIDTKSMDAVGKDRLHLRPIRSGYWQPEITVVRLRNPVDEKALKEQQQFKDGDFQGAHALIFDRAMKKYWVYKAVFPRGGEWFEVSVSLSDWEDVPRSSWYPYLSSFVYPDPKYVAPSTGPTSRPGNAPTTFHIDADH
jgi:hypothetical protein